MLDAQLQTVMLGVAALVIGAVIFGGTTLAYFMGNRPSQAAPVVVKTQQGSDHTVVEHDVEAPRKAA